jgi:hypothetical protein
MVDEYRDENSLELYDSSDGWRDQSIEICSLFQRWKYSVIQLNLIK